MRTSFFAVICLSFVGLTQVCSATDQPAPRFVRQRLNDFVADPAKLGSLVRGVTEMKRRNSALKDSAEYRTSWEYWAAIHGCIGQPPACNGTVEQIKDFLRGRFPDFPLYEGFYVGLTNMSAPDDLATRLWATCEHGRPAPYFLPWHRMYLYWFERTLRKASGDPNFALPYWDYTSATPATVPEQSPWRLPTAFVCNPTAPCNNPLSETRRTGNFGLSVQLDTVDTNIDGDLANPAFADFTARIEGGIHAHVHCAVGNGCRTPYLGVVPLAANDVLFWHHHSNIDRLWECWRNKHGSDVPELPATAAWQDWLSAEFSFVDENGDEKKMSVGQLFAADGPIDYTYDNVEKCLRQDGPVMTADASNSRTARPKPAPRIDIATAEQLRITLPEQEVALTSVQDSNADEARARIRSAGPMFSQAFLTLEGMSVEGSPGASVRVSLVDPASKREVFIGVLGFFGLEQMQHKGHPHRGDDASAEGGNQVFDITSPLRELVAQGGAPQDVRVKFTATTGLVGDSSTAAEARSASEAQYRSAGVSFRKLRIQVERP